ncbi:MAG: PhoH family protein [Fibrobacteres bacterium]|nr:PhoH family protein [Fibrobacterota bacterium]
MFSFNLAATDDEKIQLAGEGEKNFIRLERTFHVKLLTRNPGITIQAGEELQVRNARAAVERMRDALRTGHQLTDFYVQEILAGGSTSGAATVDGGATGDFAPHLEKPILIDRFGHPVQPKTRGQARFINVIKQHDIVLAGGPAGTGKTFLAVAMAVQALEKKLVDRIILVRPAVESGESLGFLPGAIGDKIGPYMRPLYDSLSLMLSTEKLKEYWDGNSIEIAPLAYMRGRTLGKSFIILDEAQNTSISQMKMFLTRIGINSKAVLTGDETQVDLDKFEKSGFAHARKILAGIEGIGQIELTVEDVVRHRLVRDIIKAYEKSGFPT